MTDRAQSDGGARRPPTDRDGDEPDALELHQEPLRPFSLGDTLLALPIWSVGLAHLAGWLMAFAVLDRTIMNGQRFDKLGKFVCRRVTDLAGIRVVRHGLDNLAPGASYVFCINHVSMLDLFVVFQSIPHFHRSFQDEKQFSIPIYGGLIRLFGQVPVRRGDKAFNARAFARAVQMLHAGDSFVVFPEGHRTRDGRLGSFYEGAFRLAAQAQVEVVPMALKGLRDVAPATDWRIRPGRVDVVFGAPISCAGVAADDVQALRRLAQRTRVALDALLRADYT